MPLKPIRAQARELVPGRFLGVVQKLGSGLVDDDTMGPSRLECIQSFKSKGPSCIKCQTVLSSKGSKNFGQGFTSIRENKCIYIYIAIAYLDQISASSPRSFS